MVVSKCNYYSFSQSRVHLICESGAKISKLRILSTSCSFCYNLYLKYIPTDDSIFDVLYAPLDFHFFTNFTDFYIIIFIVISSVNILSNNKFKNVRDRQNPKSYKNKQQLNEIELNIIGPMPWRKIKNEIIKS